MIYGFIIKAEEGWFAVVTNRDGNLHNVAIKYWGVELYPRDIDNAASASLGCSSNFIALDELQNSFLNKKNFVGVMDPNIQYSKNYWKDAARLKAIELGWLSD